MRFIITTFTVDDQQIAQSLFVRLHHKVKERLTTGFDRLPQQIEAGIQLILSSAQFIQNPLLNAVGFIFQRGIEWNDLQIAPGQEILQLRFTWRFSWRLR